MYLGPNTCSCEDGLRNTYDCVRTLNATANTIFCTWTDGAIEYYNLTSDLWQRENEAPGLPPSVLSVLEAQVGVLKTCQGHECVHVYPATGSVVKN